jgi:hypothetical protein
MSGIDSTPSPLTKEFQEMLNVPIEVEFECNLKDSAVPSGMSMRKVALSVIDGKMTLRVGDAVIDKAKFLGQYAALPAQAGNAMQNAYKLVMDANVKAHSEKK